MRVNLELDSSDVDFVRRISSNCLGGFSSRTMATGTTGFLGETTDRKSISVEQDLRRTHKYLSV